MRNEADCRTEPAQPVQGLQESFRSQVRIRLSFSGYGDRSGGRWMRQGVELERQQYEQEEEWFNQCRCFVDSGRHVRWRFSLSRELKRALKIATRGQLLRIGHVYDQPPNIDRRYTIQPNFHGITANHLVK